MKSLYRYFTYLFIVFFFTACTDAANNPVTTTAEQKPANVILMVGDGMGLSQISLGIMAERMVNLNIERFKSIGLLKTYSAKEKVTDSGAGATAFAIGKKTYNGAIGVDKDTVSHETILEYLESKGFSSGLVVTSSVTHATPASFYAHSKSRHLEENIAMDLVKSDLDFFAGGGLQYFNKREDKQNLVEQLIEKGWAIDTTSLQESVNDKPKGFLLAQDGMPKMSEGRKDFLPRATNIALNNLSERKNGFFLVVEGSQIDWAGHANQSEYLVDEFLDFDEAIGVVLDFAKNEGNTLVIVTADHETGGLALASKNGDYSKMVPEFATSGHTATMVPVFAFGPGAESFTGIYENTDIYNKIKSLFSRQ